MAQTVSVVICKLGSKTCSSFLVNEVLLGISLGFNVNEIVEETKTEREIYSSVRYYVSDQYIVQSEGGLNEQESVCQSLGCSALLYSLQ